MANTVPSTASKLLTTILILLLGVAVIMATAWWKGPSSFVFAWCTHFMLMMMVTAVIQSLKPRLTSPYYQLKPFEQGGKIYKWFGVDAFRKLLVIVGWEKLIRASNPISKNTDRLRKLEYVTRQSELGHLVIFFSVLMMAIPITIMDGIKGAAALLILNIILHFYPVILQRYNRPKYQRLLAIAIKKESTL
ncbi:glycosyl-4,4'-diaponeurosporenoate acyltransferase CrtO family protein [Mucilaginibacter myungsuensis]|uniref:Glycosyl-4,4'-diaponeurosporenoate acyltransferase n=1 Tax=Mucilaginibacter myungsuensis TaxID=649104 RepID=A0A929KXT9_9SPHI|nr:hypothetical protein [Mucilaginibacter myungsuensis]MBE9663639.1 hypothetical protein [Mucilaginibacter myungsuensis]MDN3599037.1 hypothetical protein [Mucilaginibacter myungsuensis]